MAGPEDDALEAAVAEAMGNLGGQNKVESFIGQTIYNPANVENQYRIEKGRGGMLELVNIRSGGRALFRGGNFVTADGRQVQIDPAGNGLGKPRNLSQTEYANYQQTGRTDIGLEDLINGIGGSSRSPVVAGAQAPDPKGAASLLFDYYDRQVAAGLLKPELALKEFTANLDRAERMNTDIRERQIAESTRAMRVAEEAGSRARTIAQDILPRSLPNTQQINLPLLGSMQLNQVNLDQLFNQGLPPLAQMPAIPTTPSVAYPGEFDMGEINLPPLPDIGQYVNATAGGFKGWAY